MKTNLLNDCKGDLSELKRIVKRVEKISQPRAAELEEKHDTSEQLYEATKNRCDVVAEKLKVSEDQWRAYRDGVVEFQRWMDEVDAALKEVEGESLDQRKYEQNINSFKVSFNVTTLS